MGQEIESSQFRHKDFQRFNSRLREETRLLGEWFEQGVFSHQGRVGGFELEVWLVDENGQPQAINDRYLKLTEANNLPVVAELAQFNVELNSEPRPLRGHVLSQMYAELETTWRQCSELARQIDTSLMMIGILPTVTDKQLILSNMSNVKRFRALNEQVLRLRDGRPLIINIHGQEILQLSHGDVMFESAATSYQLHMQVALERAARYYNAAHILSAPMVAICANSPYLFGRNLWDETRIPLFEQAVALEDVYGAQGKKISRVTFASGYVESSVYECFRRNLENYPVLLPALSDSPPEELAHLRLHNGTIWRWNRPLIGFDEAGVPHLRLEHRVVPSGPTVIDAIANAALFFGAIEMMARAEIPPEAHMDFNQARTNFYTAAREGLRAKLTWLDGKQVSVLQLLQQEILPIARKGLHALAVDQADIDLYLGIIEGRIKTQCNGAVWQRRYVAKHHADMSQLTLAYRERQQQGQPVHEWSL